MIRKRRFSLLVFVISLMFLASGAVGVSADSGAVSYLIGSGFLCGLASSACPVISRAQENDDTIAMTGVGTFAIHPESITGGGTFTHRDPAGTVLATGTWTATRLLSFVSYGGSPTVVGGQALILVHLMPSGGSGVDAVLQVHCSLGRPPEGHETDDIKLAVQGGLNFNKGVSGFTVFMLP